MALDSPGAAVVILALGFVVATAPSEPGVQMVVQSDSAATSSVSLDARPWGTAIVLDLEELPPNNTYVAWAIHESGERQQVAVWGPTPNSSATVSGASSFATGDLELIVVTPVDESEALLVAVNDDG